VSTAVPSRCISVFMELVSVVVEAENRIAAILGRSNAMNEADISRGIKNPLELNTKLVCGTLTLLILLAKMVNAAIARAILAMLSSAMLL